MATTFETPTPRIHWLKSSPRRLRQTVVAPLRQLLRKVSRRGFLLASLHGCQSPYRQL